MKCWEYRGIFFTENFPLRSLSDESVIRLNNPCYIDIDSFGLHKKPRKQFRVEFDKVRFDQGYYHSFYDDSKNKRSQSNTNDNINLINDAVTTHAVSGDDEKVPNVSNVTNVRSNYNYNNKQQRLKQPKKANSVKEVFEFYPFEHSPVHTISKYVKDQMSQFVKQFTCGHYTTANALEGILKEVIKNGYERDLLPINDSINSSDENKIVQINMIENMINKIKNQLSNVEVVDETDAYKIINKIYLELIQQLSKIYKIFELLMISMRHPRHKMMGCPLELEQMLALILYCDGDCNYDLCKTQREYTVTKKWPYFHYILNDAINKLSQFETHYEHIYTGVCGVFLESKIESQSAYFQSNVSFSTDLNIALQFHGDSGIIIGLNMQRIFNPDYFVACDVSWISSVPSEKEILCTIGSSIRVYDNFVRKRGNTQLIVFVEDELDPNKAFQSMFDRELVDFGFVAFLSTITSIIKFKYL